MKRVFIGCIGLILWISTVNAGPELLRSAFYSLACATSGAFVAADMDADGRVDLVCGGVDSTVTVLLSGGDNTFVAQATNVGRFVQAIATGDIDENGTPDVIVVSDAGVSIVFRNASGFSGQTAWIAVSGGVTSVAAGDVNGDGHVDIALTCYTTGRVVVFVGDGTGAVLMSNDLNAGVNPRRVIIRDIDRDGYADLCNVASGTSQVCVRYGGPGGFGGLVQIPVGPGPMSLSLVDLNGDGIDDFVAGSDGALSVILSTASRAYGGRIDYPTASGAYDIAILSSPSGTDLIAAGDGFSRVEVNGDGTLGAEERWPSRGDFVEVLDVDSDGFDDVAMMDISSGCILVTQNSPSGEFVGPVNLNLVSGAVSGIWVGDIDRDGVQDIVAQQGNSRSRVEVFRGQGGLEFVEDEVLQLSRPLSPMIMVDLNGDGWVDAVGSITGDTIGVYLNQPGGVLQFHGVFRANGTVRTVGDIDQDGNIDVVAGGSSGVTCYLGDGAGGFTPGAAMALPASGGFVAIGDVDGDGIVDIVTSRAQDSVYVNRGLGGGAFGPRQGTYRPGGPAALSVDDVDGDGKSDVAICTPAGGSPTVLSLWNGATFAKATSLDGIDGSGSQRIVIADMDEDGAKDVIVGAWARKSAAVWLGNGRGSFSPSREFGTGLRPSLLLVDDVTGDGHLDVITTTDTFGTARIAILRGSGELGVGVLGAPSPSRASGVRVLPNPSRSGVRFDLGVSGFANAKASICDVAGRVVRRIESRDAKLEWDGTDASGMRVPRGIYFARFTTREGGGTTRIVLID